MPSLDKVKLKEVLAIIFGEGLISKEKINAVSSSIALLL
jgi:hypothetical protein